MNLDEISIGKLSTCIKSGEIKSEEVVSYFLENIHRTEPTVKAFISLFEDEAIRVARQLDGRKQKSGKLFGVPVAVKDNMNVEGFESTAGSQILKGYVSPYDATVVRKLKEENAIIVGKTNLDEFAMGSSTENSAFFKTRNPVDPERVPGGSSGGSAAAVSARMVAAALGSDTGGSIRQPAAFCNTVGLKPTYGRVSRYGLIAFGSSLDCIGPITRTVEDAALMLEVIAGFDHHDETTVDIEVDSYTSFLQRGIEKARFGVIKEIQDFEISPEILTALKEACEKILKLGGEIEEISIPHLKYSLPVYYLIAPSEASANLARFDGVRYGFEAEAESLKEFYSSVRTRGFGDEVKRRILIGTFALSEGYYDAYYLKASKVRRLIEKEFEASFEKVDCILLPTTPTLPFRFGERKSPLEMYVSDIFTIPVSLVGLPAISIPFGQKASGFIPGIQLVGKWFEESRLLQYANALFLEG